MRKKIAVLISGNGSNLQALIDATLSPDYPAEIVLVLSNKAEAYGLTRAMNAGIHTEVVPHKAYPTRELFDAAMQEKILESGAEIICLAGFMRLLTPGFVGKWPERMLNIHPSLLPAFKGHDAIGDALAAGVRITGCSVHFVVPEMDSGPIIAQAALSVRADDTPETLVSRIQALEHKIYPLALRWLCENRLSVDSGRVRVKNAAAPENGFINPL